MADHRIPREPKGDDKIRDGLTTPDPQPLNDTKPRLLHRTYSPAVTESRRVLQNHWSISTVLVCCAASDGADARGSVHRGLARRRYAIAEAKPWGPSR